MARGPNGQDSTTDLLKYVTIKDKKNSAVLQSTLFFYKKLVGDLKLIGFVINPYNSRVANKMIRGEAINDHVAHG